MINQSTRDDPFALCRSHITQWGLMMFDNRQNIDLLNTSKTNCDQLLRELKNLDTLNCRETHKIGTKRQTKESVRLFDCFDFVL